MRLHASAASTRATPADFPGQLAIAHAGYAALFVFAGYYLGAELGLALTSGPNPISALWPPNAILFAALLLTPAGQWWVVLVAAFAAHLLAELRGGIPVAMVLPWFVSNS